MYNNNWYKFCVKYKIFSAYEMANCYDLIEAP